MYRQTRRVLIVTTSLFALTSAAFAIGSGEETPEDKAAKSDKKAVALYNDGVKAMANARAIGLKGDSAFAYNYRATSDARARKEFDKAVIKFTAALELKPDMPEAYNNLGYCYRKLGELDKSLAAYEKAISLKPDFAQAREYRGETWLALGQPDKAKGELDFLKQMRSPLADTLARAIEIYQLEKVNKKMGSR